MAVNINAAATPSVRMRTGCRGLQGNDMGQTGYDAVPYFCLRCSKWVGHTQKSNTSMVAIKVNLCSTTVEGKSDAAKKTKSNGSFLGYMAAQIAAQQSGGKLGTAQNYRRAMASFSSFLGGGDIAIKAIDEELVFEYADWLQRRGVVRNSSSFYMRILRSVYNKAVEQHLVEQKSPFRNAYTGVDKTRKRAVGEETVLRLQRLDLGSSRPLALARDLFVFSYCTRGMSFVDIAFLRKDDIRNGVICYVRRKTGQRLSVRIEPCIEIIIARYAVQTAGSAYVFPILTTEEPEKAYEQYQIALSYHNRKLKRLRTLIGENLSLSSYTARHSWATAARKHNVPIAVISEGMGHTSEKTTQIYLASLENSVIDRANSQLLKTLNTAVPNNDNSAKTAVRF